METLWAPWRVELFRTPQPTGCFFCRYLSEGQDAENLVLERGESCFVVMNRYPYTNGHLLIVPYQHTGELAEVDSLSRAALFQYAIRWQMILKRAIHAQGFNLGMNLGKAAGAGVADHVHLHIVPRWVGDTNFMPVLTDSKVINQSLTDLYECLKDLARQFPLEE